ncbi:predicted protein [Naegleria gruberi]|uniref:Predicted protein n=1 Tax=Naegleria gruberi TaxID=5762 RepID=D2UYY1_NAEGR|nr:uncharacterized protein NAEGRDRAFT_61743 [Naegleria gruberi]EFC49855.1 predicted protein [Naegleria gruberi]|eukprot:XP_002682599.1 predicted protein [Naegleria gruberi strain NEG-M]
MTNYNKFSIIEFTSNSNYQQHSNNNSTTCQNSTQQKEQPKKRGRPVKTSTSTTNNNNTHMMIVKSTEMLSTHVFSPSKLQPYEHVLTQFVTCDFSKAQQQQSMISKKKKQVRRNQNKVNCSIENEYSSTSNQSNADSIVPLCNFLATSSILDNSRSELSNSTTMKRIIRTSISIKELLN